jgi:hypothetical protein
MSHSGVLAARRLGGRSENVAFVGVNRDRVFLPVPHRSPIVSRSDWRALRSIALSSGPARQVVGVADVPPYELAKHLRAIKFRLGDTNGIAEALPQLIIHAYASERRSLWRHCCSCRRHCNGFWHVHSRGVVCSYSLYYGDATGKRQKTAPAKRLQRETRALRRKGHS